MVRHTTIGKDTKIKVNDEVLYNGVWEKVTETHSEKKDYLILGEKIVYIKELIPIWEVLTFRDSSGDEPEYSISLQNASIRHDVIKITLFTENSGINLTDANFKKLTLIANKVKEFMNKEQITFETREEPCR